MPCSTQGRELGVVVDGTLTSAGRALLAGDGSLAAALAQSLPGQVDQLILQADLTAIVPGLPTPALAELMRTVADAESTGAASVYRFSTDSIRRALDSGRAAGELLGELSRRGTVPQPLAYLIEDVARRHAVLRIGSAATFLRCDDPVVLAGIMADPGAAHSGCSPSPTPSWPPSSHPSTCWTACASWAMRCSPSRGAGPPPMPPGGRAGAPRRRRRAPCRRAPHRHPRAGRSRRARDPGQRPGRRRRAGRRSGLDADTALHPVPTMDPDDVMAVLRSAIATDSPVWIGYADPTGVAGDRRVEPLRLAGRLPDRPGPALRDHPVVRPGPDHRRPARLTRARTPRSSAAADRWPETWMEPPGAPESRTNPGRGGAARLSRPCR